MSRGTENIVDTNVKFLDGASQDELLRHLRDQLSANRVRKFGVGSASKMIAFIKNQLEDRFSMDEDLIKKALEDIKL